LWSVFFDGKDTKKSGAEQKKGILFQLGWSIFAIFKGKVTNKKLIEKRKTGQKARESLQNACPNLLLSLFFLQPICNMPFLPLQRQKQSMTSVGVRI